MLPPFFFCSKSGCGLYASAAFTPVSTGNSIIHISLLEYIHFVYNICVLCTSLHYTGKTYTGALGDFAPEMQKRALENQKRASENRHRLQCNSLFNVADLVNGM